ncbi:MAG: HAD hydrolase family protein [Thermoleophilaceae bacterium]|nr:HAD hydrolase family protein [Thermoleophilaceae bacterium]
MIRCVYTDLDGTLLGPRASLFAAPDGEGFSMLAARGLEACHRAGIEVVLKSGRRRAQVMEDARLIGQRSYIFEIGSGLVVDGELTWLTGEWAPRDGRSTYELIEESGAPALLLERYRGRFEHHEPWHTEREVSHLMRGLVDVDEADALLRSEGIHGLRLVDNGEISPKETLLDLGARPHAYHLIPATASKANAVAAHMRTRGYAREEAIAVGDSREDAGVADVVGRFFLVANADRAVAIGERTEASYGEGFYEAVVRALAESR